MIEFTKPGLFKARIRTKNRITESVYFVQYELTEPRELVFLAGQTMMIKVAPGVHRAMSIASPPQQKQVLDSYQDVAPMGVGSKWLLERKIGDEVEFMAPLGRFVIDHDSPRKRIMVATGTGIAPFKSMLMDESDGLSANKQVSLYWGMRYNRDLYLQDELKRIDEQYSNFTINMVISRPDEGWSGLKGHVTEHVFGLETDIGNCDFYLCGNKKMIMEMQQRLSQNGVGRERMKFDPFY